MYENMQKSVIDRVREPTEKNMNSMCVCVREREGDSLRNYEWEEDVCVGWRWGGVPYVKRLIRVCVREREPKL